jgi:competence/damage-inducible protein CinA-like protein
MPSAEIITIGTEILLGEIVDTNTSFLARTLRDAGIDLFRTMTVGDNANRIAQAIDESLKRSDIVITTGGLGPTVDDPTREAVALAMGVETEFHPELWEQIQARFQRYRRHPTENNKRQAYIPKGSIPVENPVGTAPAFIAEKGAQSVVSLPGVPHEMEYVMVNAILPYLRQRYRLDSVILARVLHTAGVGESQIDDRIGDLEMLTNPTVGLAAHSGQVDVRIVAKAGSRPEAEVLIQGVENDLRQRLGKWIYGADEETLEAVALRALIARGWTLAVVEAGIGGEMIQRLASANSESFQGGEILPQVPSLTELKDITAAFCRSHQAQVGLGVAMQPGIEKQEIYYALITPESEQTFNRPYGGPPGYAPRWAVNHGMDLIRRLEG